MAADLRHSFHYEQMHNQRNFVLHVNWLSNYKMYAKVKLYQMASDLQRLKGKHFLNQIMIQHVHIRCTFSDPCWERQIAEKSWNDKWFLSSLSFSSFSCKDADPPPYPLSLRCPVRAPVWTRSLLPSPSDQGIAIIIISAVHAGH